MSERIPSVIAAGVSMVIIAYACATAPSTTNPSPSPNAGVAAAPSQMPPGGPGGPPPGPGHPGDGPGEIHDDPHHNPLFHELLHAIDTDGDGIISMAEMNHAAESLLKLDKNGDGKLTQDELRPHRPRGGGDGPGWGPGPDGQRPDGQRPNGQQPPLPQNPPSDN
jgi:hypothetical protein